MMQTGHLDELRQLLAPTPFGSGPGGDMLLRDFERRVIAEGRIFAMEGDPAGNLAVVAEGTVRATRRVSDDRDLTVFLLTRGDVFGFLPLLDGGPYPLSLTAESTATLYVLDRRLFRHFLEANPRFCAHLLSHVAARLRECIDQLGMLGKPGAMPRVAAALLSELPPEAAPGAVIAWPMPQTKLAQALGIAPENLSRAVSRLQQLGILRRTAGHRLRIDDPARLRATAERSLL